MDENKIVRTVLFVLFLWLFFVYIIFFNIKSSNTITDKVDNTIETGKFVLNTINESWQNLTKKTWLVNNILYYHNRDLGENLLTWTSVITWNWLSNSGDNLIPIPWFKSEPNIDIVSSGNGDNNIKSNLKILSWTKPFFGEIEVTKTLWLQYKYILEDKKWIYYVYMGTWVYDYEKNAKLLWWNVVYIRTELDLQKNNLPWDMVIFVNIPNITYIKSPKFKRLLVFMIVYFGKEQRVVQIPYDIYYKNKKYIKKLFNDLYK